MSRMSPSTTDLSIRENLEFYAGVYGIPPPAPDRAIELVNCSCGLQGQEQMLTRRLLGGWKQRVAFGAGQCWHDPEVLFSR